ncbi:hypothetical protein OIU77_015409 [Salix suchowensis]|uniref:Uncharacterized protein n=1 Tax=Salix suchowensis TaxID=1278906 RepID=A0ABQ8ZGW3_9ROSI|nr:hypothetical protein OIU77_015409 [Salix suchowensis]
MRIVDAMISFFFFGRDWF